jgi:hypothetical protein
MNKKITRRRLTAEELEEARLNLLRRKSELWQEISEDIEGHHIHMRFVQEN